MKVEAMRQVIDDIKAVGQIGFDMGPWVAVYYKSHMWPVEPCGMTCCIGGYAIARDIHRRESLPILESVMKFYDTMSKMNVPKRARKILGLPRGATFWQGLFSPTSPPLFYHNHWPLAYQRMPQRQGAIRLMEDMIAGTVNPVSFTSERTLWWQRFAKNTGKVTKPQQEVKVIDPPESQVVEEERELTHV